MCHGESPHRTQWYRLLQPLLPRPQEGWWPQAYPRSEMSELRTHQMALQNVNYQTNPCTNSPRGLVYVSGSERWLLDIQISTHYRSFLRFHSKGWHTQLSRWLPSYCPIDTHPQISAPQTSRGLGLQGQLWQEFAAPQPTNFILWLSSNEGLALTRMHLENQDHGHLVQSGVLSPPQEVSKAAGPHGGSFLYHSAGHFGDHSSSR